MSGNKTEQPTPKRIREARRKGQVFKSNDLTQAFLFMAGAGILVATGGVLVNELKLLLTGAFQPSVLSGEMQHDEMLRRFGDAWFRMLLATAPLMAALVVVSGAVTFLQVQSLFAPEVLKPKLEKINPLKNFENIFLKGKTYLTLLMNAIKFVIVAAVIFYTIRSSLRDIVVSTRMDLQLTAVFAGQLLSTLLLRLGVVFVILGAIDFAIQKKQYMKGMMMSKYEVIKEYKEDEGDPLIKGERRQLYEELLTQDVLANTARADVIIVNPTHIAVAIRYDEQTMDAPAVTAKGELSVAQKILEIAKKNKIPVVRNKSLAWSLYALDLGIEIPEDLYDAVAEVLSWVHDLAQAEQ
jgi:flagellar biosynthesis protein FlhB